MKKIILLMTAIFLVTTVLAISLEQEIKATIIGTPEIILGDDLGGDDEIDNDGTVFATLNSNLGINCQIRWEDTWENLAENQTQDSNTSLAEGEKQVRYRCFDSHGNFLIAQDKITITKPAPEIIIHSPINNTFHEENEIPVIITLSRTVKELRYSDNGGSFRLLCQNCSETNTTKNFRDGHHFFVVKVVDEFGRLFFSQIEFQVDGKPPRIKQFTPLNNDFTNGTFTVTYSENILNNVVLFWKYTGEEDFKNLTKTDCPSGQDQTCILEANLNQQGEIDFYFEVHNTKSFDRSGVRRANVDTITPLMSLFMPLNGTFSEIKTPFNITTSEEVLLELIDTSDLRPRWSALCSNCDEYGFTRLRTRTFRDGLHNLIIRATDKAGNSAQASVNIEIDSKAPVIISTEPRRNSIFNGSQFEIMYTEENLQEVALSFNPTILLQNCLAGSRQSCSTFADLSSYDGTFIEYFFQVSDELQTTTSRTTRVFVDTTSPILTINSPEDSGIYDRRVPFNITITEKSDLEYIDNLNNNPRWRTLCSNCDEYGFTRLRTRTFREGHHDLTIRAVDEAGNSDQQEISFTVN